MNAAGGTPSRDEPLLPREWLLEHQHELLELMPHEWTLGENWNQYPLLYRIERNGLPLSSQEMYVQVMRELYSHGLIERDESNPALVMIRRGKPIEARWAEPLDRYKNEGVFPALIALFYLAGGLGLWLIGGEPSYHIGVRIPCALGAVAALGLSAYFAGEAVREVSNND